MAKDAQSPGFYARVESLDAQESRAFVSYLTHSGINVVGNLIEGKHGGLYNDSVISLSGESPANRLARVVYHRTGLLMEIKSTRALHIDENEGRIYIPKSSLLAEGEFQKCLDDVLGFVKKQKESVRVTYQAKSDKWTDSAGAGMDFRKLEGKQLEVNFGLDGLIGVVDLRESKLPYVGTVAQHIDNVPDFTKKFGAATQAVRESMEKNFDVTLARFDSSSTGKSDHYLSFIVVDHTTGKTANFRILTGDLSERRADFTKLDAMVAGIASRKNGTGAGGKAFTLMVLQTSTTPAPVDPQSLDVTKTFLKQWRANRDLNLTKISPEEVDVQVVNAWIDPDRPTPLLFHRPLSFYPQDVFAPPSDGQR